MVPNIRVMFEGQGYGQEAAAWTQFWTGRARGSEHRYRDPRTAAVLEAHWRDFFVRQFDTAEADAAAPLALVDLACGEGEVLQLAGRFAEGRPDITIDAYCADIAPDAVALAAADLPGGLEAEPAVADCSRLPFASAAFSCAVSQYGLEYAGADAFGEAARVVGEGGQFHALVHCQDGVVERACSEVATLLGQVLDSALFDALADYADTIPRAVRGEAPDAAARACVATLRAALDRVTRAGSAAPPGPARDHVARLVGDIQTLTGRLAAYAPADVAAWIAGQRADIEAFYHRMTSMVRVAQSDDQVRDLVARLEGAGLAVSPVSALPAPQDGGSLAWVLDARRDGPA